MKAALISVGTAREYWRFIEDKALFPKPNHATESKPGPLKFVQYSMGTALYGNGWGRHSMGTTGDGKIDNLFLQCMFCTVHVRRVNGTGSPGWAHVLEKLK
jgi:hypothetical protein